MNRKERRAARKQGHAVAEHAQSGWALNELGNMMVAQGRLEEAFRHYERALAQLPVAAGILCNLGSIRATQGRHAEAAKFFERALALEPRSADMEGAASARIKILLNLATLKKDLGQLDQAAALYEQVLALGPDDVEVNNNLGCVLLALGRSAEAAARFHRALALMPELLEGYADIVTMLASVNRALKDGIACAESAWPRPLTADELAANLAGIVADPLVRHVLEAAPVREIGLERLLTSIRRHLLDRAEAAGTAIDRDERMLGFCCTIARQCYINEYVFALAPEESQRAEQLAQTLAGALAEGRSIPPEWLPAIASYVPLLSLPDAPALMSRDWPSPVRGLLVQQVREPLEDRAYRDSIPRMTVIASDTSAKVRQQYEENPYPRWVHAPSRRLPISVEDHLRAVFPAVSLFGRSRKDVVDILVAGCGTGRHSVEVAQRYQGARVLAVDLSRASLGYAKRKTLAARLDNIEYAQADLLELGSLDRSFDMIDVAGVLHHLADPLAGWRVLLSLLRPGGYMHVGLYSDLARRDIAAARQYIAERGYRPVAEDIRRCRQELVQTPLKSLTRATDFFTTSECRDLLFHVQEHRFAIPQIARFLSEQNLRFIGFEIDPRIARRYADRYAYDRTMTNLDHWHIFEQENPDTFAGMYQFWLQKS